MKCKTCGMEHKGGMGCKKGGKGCATKKGGMGKFGAFLKKGKKSAKKA